MYENLNICRRVRFAPYQKGAGPTFALTLWDDAGYDSNGRIQMRYRLNMIGVNGRSVTLFQGQDITLGYGMASDSDAAVACVMAWLCLIPGDASADMFEGYSEVQMDFARSYAESLHAESSYRFSPEYAEERKAARADKRTPPTDGGSTPPTAPVAAESAPVAPTVGTVKVIRDDLSLCDDCTLLAVNGEHNADSSDERIAAVSMGLTDLSAIGHVVSDFDSESGEGIDEFSWRKCDCCGTALAGSRHRFAILGTGDVRPPVAPQYVSDADDDDADDDDDSKPVPGCYGDGASGHAETRQRCLEVVGHFATRGDMRAVAIVEALEGQMSDDASEENDACDWLNAHAPLAGHVWAWREGDFGLWPSSDE